MTIKLELTRAEIVLIVASIEEANISLTQAIGTLNNKLAEYDDTEEYPLVQLAVRNSMARQINDGERLTYYLKAKGDF